MTRSSYKLPYTAKSLSRLKNNLNSRINTSKQPGIVYSRSSTITPEMIGLNVKIHSGQKFVNFLITEHTIGYKFGEFSLTKKRALYKRKKKR